MKLNIQQRWEQHRRDGGKLTMEEFSKRKPRKRRDRDALAMRRLSKETRRELAKDVLDDLPDGAFFAAAGDMFGLDPEDFIE